MEDGRRTPEAYRRAQYLALLIFGVLVLTGCASGEADMTKRLNAVDIQAASGFSFEYEDGVEATVEEKAIFLLKMY